MNITTLLAPETVITGMTAANSAQATGLLVSALAHAKEVQLEPASRDLAARERLAPTVVPLACGVIAVPHALSSACRQVVIAAATAPEGIVWGTTGQRARLVFLVLGPPKAQALCLRVVSRIMRVCDVPGFFEAALSSASPQEFITRIGEAEAPLGEMPADDGMPRFCVLGAGHGGMAMAGHLALSGCHVNLFNRSEARLEAVQARGGIDVTGEVGGFAALNIVTTDPAKALDNTDVVMVVVPATAHKDVAELIAPHIKDGQILVLNPGRTGGALEVTRIIRQKNPAVRPYIAEAQTLLYAARVTNPGQVHIFSIKNSVPLAVLPAYQIPDVVPVIRKALPQFVPGGNVLQTSFDNIGAVFHPAITILNAARIEDTHGEFQYYVEGVTPAVAQVLEAIDRERMKVAGALGIHVHTAREWLYLAYDAAGKTLLDAMRANPGYAGITAPGTVQHRYISEDVPASLVPIASIGEMLKVPTPTIRAIIHLASVMHGVDYWAQGRTVERLGINGMSVKDIRFLTVGAEATAPQEAAK